MSGVFRRDAIYRVSYCAAILYNNIISFRNVRRDKSRLYKAII